MNALEELGLATLVQDVKKLKAENHTLRQLVDDLQIQVRDLKRFTCNHRTQIEELAAKTATSITEPMTGTDLRANLKSKLLGEEEKTVKGADILKLMSCIHNKANT